MAVATKGRDFSREQCVTGLRTAMSVLDKWRASPEQACRILRISNSTYTHAKQCDPAQPIDLNSDQLHRISIVLNIHATLRTVFNNPDNVYGFPSMGNRNEFFNGRSPLEIMAQGDITAIYETLKQIDTLRDT